MRKTYRFVGSAPALQDVYARITSAAKATYPVLITGETGTGKELAARAVHELSDRADGPFLTCNCAAVPDNLVESEMFGYAPHSGIANANPQGKAGKFEAADGGTLFLDEIGDFSAQVQAKLLRVLQDQNVERIGANTPVHVNVRVVAATNQDLEAMLADGRFREDLYHRLNVLHISLPPLRDRPSDVLLLAAYFLEQHVPAPANETLRITHETARLLTSYRWPGNIRELQNAVLRAALHSTTSRLDPEHFDLSLPDRPGASPVVKTLRQAEKAHIEQVLRIAVGNKRKAARLLDISPQTLYTKLEEYQIRPPPQTLDK